MLSTHKLSTGTNSPVTRALDAIDRGHARLADRVHTARNALRAVVERSLDRVERLATSSIAAARTRVKRADAVTADAIIYAQGAVGKAIEKARMARTLPEHAAS